MVGHHTPTLVLLYAIGGGPKSSNYNPNLKPAGILLLPVNSL